MQVHADYNPAKFDLIFPNRPTEAKNGRIWRNLAEFHKKGGPEFPNTYNRTDTVFCILKETFKEIESSGNFSIRFWRH